MRNSPPFKKSFNKFAFFLEILEQQNFRILWIQFRSIKLSLLAVFVQYAFSFSSDKYMKKELLIMLMKNQTHTGLRHVSIKGKTLLFYQLPVVRGIFHSTSRCKKYLISSKSTRGLHGTGITVLQSKYQNLFFRTVIFSKTAILENTGQWILQIYLARNKVGNKTLFLWVRNFHYEYSSSVLKMCWLWLQPTNQKPLVLRKEGYDWYKLGRYLKLGTSLYQQRSV